MAHKTLVGGTAYNITGGKSMVSGTVHNIKSGKTLVDGTYYNINLDNYNDGIADQVLLYNTGDFVFQNGSSIEEGKTLITKYAFVEDAIYQNMNQAVWHESRGNIKNVYFKHKISPTSIAYWFTNCYYLNNFNKTNFDTSKLTDMAYAYQHSGFTGQPFCGANVVNMVGTYWDSKCKGIPVCGPNVTNMDYAYYYCRYLTGSPVCGNNVTTMTYAYGHCNSLTGQPVCGPNVIDMSLAYYNCQNLKFSPVCGDKVINMYGTYYNCYNLTGSPVCGPNVTFMHRTYSGCKNLTGSPVCGPKVTSMFYAYDGCKNLTGSPICGPNVKDMFSAYCNCSNIAGNAYFYSNNVTNAKGCFAQKSNYKRLNIYVHSGSNTNTIIHRSNAFSLVNTSITWTDAGSYQYNTAYNIYIYPVANVAAAAIANGEEEANANAGIIIDGSDEGDVSSPANYTVESVNGASYGFSLNNNGYYESGNKGVKSSAAVCKVNIIADGTSKIIFDCINYGESNYDYGLLSTVDKTLTTSSTADTSNVFKSFKGLQQSTVQSVNYGVLSAGTHSIYVKYIKDSSINNNNDSLQFKVRATTPSSGSNSSGVHSGGSA